jgi:hypothetical protein
VDRRPATASASAQKTRLHVILPILAALYGDPMTYSVFYPETPACRSTAMPSPPFLSTVAVATQ